jgi:hypothetical protein
LRALPEHSTRDPSLHLKNGSARDDAMEMAKIQTDPLPVSDR